MGTSNCQWHQIWLLLTWAGVRVERKGCQSLSSQAVPSMGLSSHTLGFRQEGPTEPGRSPPARALGFLKGGRSWGCLLSMLAAVCHPQTEGRSVTAASGQVSEGVGRLRVPVLSEWAKQESGGSSG